MKRILLLITGGTIASRAGMAVAVCSQCLYESSDFTLYQAGQTDDLDQVQSLFARSLTGVRTQERK